MSLIYAAAASTQYVIACTSECTVALLHTLLYVLFKKHSLCSLCCVLYVSIFYILYNVYSSSTAVYIQYTEYGTYYTRYYGAYCSIHFTEYIYRHNTLYSAVYARWCVHDANSLKRLLLLMIYCTEYI